MAFPRLIAILPCYSLDEISSQLDDEKSLSFHACWSALWHPVLLASSDGIPEWKRADASSLDVTNSLILCPASIASSLDTPLRERLNLQGCTIVEVGSSRSDAIQQIVAIARERHGNPSTVLSSETLDSNTDASTVEGIDHAESNDKSLSTRFNDYDVNLSQISWSSVTEESGSPPPDLWGQPKSTISVDDFYALGTAVLLLQSLTRKVHYSSNLDPVLLAEQCRQASLAFLDNDPPECERWLQAGFDQLSQERDRYFSQMANLIDLTLLANTTLGKSLERQLQQAQPQNVLATSNLLKQLRDVSQESWETLKVGVQAKRVSIAGGLECDRDHSHWPIGTLYRDFERGHQAYHDLGVSPPKVFSQYAAGYFNSLPQHLLTNGCSGTLLASFTGFNCPTTEQAKVAWEATDGSTIDTISGAILDAASPKAILGLVATLSKQFDYHQIPTVVFAHWPNRVCTIYQDLLKAATRTTAFGKWTTLDDYFASTGRPYSNQTFKSSQFRSSLPDQYSQWNSTTQTNLQRNRLIQELESIRNIAIQVALIGAKSTRTNTTSVTKSDDPCWTTSVLAKTTKLLSELELLPLSDSSNKSSSNSIDGLNAYKALKDSIRIEVGEQLAKNLPRQKNSTDNLPANGGYLLLNPFPGPTRVFLKGIEGSFSKQQNDRIYELTEANGRTDLIVDLPPMGVVKLNPIAMTANPTETKVVNASKSSSLKGLTKGLWRSSNPMIASSNLLLANEFIECQIDPKSGYLRSLMISKKRGGRLSGMPSILLTDHQSKDKPRYADFQNVSHSTVFNSSLRGEIEVNGDFYDGSKKLGEFKVKYGLWRGARHVDLECEIRLTESVLKERESAGGLWRLSPIWRTAWPSQAASLSTWELGAKTSIHSATFSTESPIEIDDLEHRIDVQWNIGSLHHRIDYSFIDTLFTTDEQGVACGKGRIAVDWQRPYQASLEFQSLPWIVEDNRALLNVGTSVWFAQSNLPNVTFSITDWKTVEQDVPEGIDLRIQETSGKSCNAKLAFFKDVTSANIIQIDGTIMEELKVVEGEVLIPLRNHQVSLIRLQF